MAARVRTLPAAVAPVLVGTSLALGAGTFHPLAFVAALQSPEAKTRFAALMAEPVWNTPQEFGRFMHAELLKYEKVVKLSGAKVD